MELAQCEGPAVKKKCQSEPSKQDEKGKEEEGGVVTCLPPPNS